MKIRMKVPSIVATAALLILFVAEVSPAGADEEAGPWKKFTDAQISFKVPDGWTLVDPFTPETPHWNHFWYKEMPARDTRAALLKSPARREFQILFELGSRAELGPVVNGKITKFNDNPRKLRIIQHTGRSADHVEVKLFTAQLAAQGPDEEEMTYIVGYAVAGERLFVINGGAPTKSFNQEILYELIQSLDLGTK